MKNMFLFLLFLSCYATHIFGSQEIDSQETQLDDTAIKDLFSGYHHDNATDAQPNDYYNDFSEPLADDNQLIAHDQSENENNYNNGMHIISQHSQDDREDVAHHQRNQNRMIRIVTIKRNNS